MTQYARPESLYSNSGWSAYGAATIPEAIDEEAASDAEYAYTESDGTYFGVVLSEVTDPEGNTGHTLSTLISAYGPRPYVSHVVHI